MSNWYSITNVLSYDKLLNMIIGPRGTGKTYGFKKWAINDFIKSGKQFVWVRRFKDETDTIQAFYDDLIDNEEFTEHKLTVKKGKILSHIKVDGKIAGYAIALTKSQQIKSTPFPKVDKIIFDEFLITVNTMHYIPNEVEVFLELMSTVFRKRKVRGAYLVANNTNFNNPYFNYFGIKKFNGRFFLPRNNKQVLAEFYANEAYAQEVNETQFGELIRGTKYGAYNVYNETLRGNSNFIAKKPPTATYLCAIKYLNSTLGFWFDANNGKVYCNEQYNPEAKQVLYALTRDDHSENTWLIEKRKYQHNFKLLVLHYNDGQMYFSNSQVKSIGEEIIFKIS